LTPLRELTKAERSRLQLRPVIRIVPRSSEAKVTCELQDPSLTECLASSLDGDRLVLASNMSGTPAKYVLGPLIVDAADVASASAVRGQVEWTVAVSLTTEKAEVFKAATKAAAGAAPPQDQIAVIVEGEIVSSPTVLSPIENGALEISGGFSGAQAKSLASSLNPTQPTPATLNADRVASTFADAWLTKDADTMRTLACPAPIDRVSDDPFPFRDAHTLGPPSKERSPDAAAIAVPAPDLFVPFEGMDNDTRVTGTVDITLGRNQSSPCVENYGVTMDLSGE